MGLDVTKATLKEILSGFIAKGAIALTKLIKSKLLPKAEERYCRALKATADKITNKTADRIAKLAKEEDKKKRVAILYLLKLISDTLVAVSESLTTTANYVKENVDFKELEDPSEEALVALAEIPGALDNDGGCGANGCEIA